MLISVIIPVYKVELYLRQCVDSVREQTYSRLEIILVDDGSPDNCGRICDEYAAMDPRIRVIHQENQGLSAARNAGLEVARGDVIAFVDSDDWLEPDMYERMLRLMEEKNLDVVLCGADREYEGQVLKELGRYYTDGAVVDAREIFNLCMQDRILSHCWNRLCRRHCMEQMRFPVGKLYEDIYVSPLPFAAAVRPVGFLHAPLYHYRHNPKGITGSVNWRESYYMYLGRRALLDYAGEKAPELVDICLARVVSIGTNACSVGLRNPYPQAQEDMAQIRQFLRKNRRAIRKSRDIPLGKKLQVFLLLHCGLLYRLLMKKGQR